MSVIDEILVLLDDGNAVELSFIREKIKGKTLQTVSSTLGRLEAKGWISIKKEKKQKLFQITSLGQEEVTKNLSRIKELKKLKTWNGSWQIVVFNIPEKNRYARDVFRTKLESIGFGKIQGSLWISARAHDEDLNEIIKKLKINNFVTVFNTGKLSESDGLDLANKFEWDWKNLNAEYKKFIDNSKRFLKSKKDNFEARVLVYNYAKILKLDPQFAEEIQPKDYLGNKAYEMYEKVRTFCY